MRHEGGKGEGAAWERKKQKGDGTFDKCAKRKKGIGAFESLGE